jgi:hypothetical protein
MRKILPGVILSLFGVMSLFGQDNHYEYMKLGSRNSVLANAGLPRFEDQAAVIINPATLSFAVNSSFSFNTTAVGVSRVNFENGLGQGYDIKFMNLNVLPTTAAGVLKPKKNEKDWVLGYALFHAINDRLRFSDRNKYDVDMINNIESPGMETYLAQYNLSHDVDEVSAVLGVGWNVSEKLALGVSQSFTYRAEEYLSSFTASSIPGSDQAKIDFVTFNRNFYTRYYRILTQTKFGLAWNPGKWNIGVTATLPALGLFGTGEVSGEVSLYNIRLAPTEPRESFFANGRAEKQKATYKKSMALGVGATRRFGNVRLYGAVNAYAGIKKYSIMDPGPVDFIQPPTAANIAGSANFMRVWAGNQTVVNGSIAADWNHDEKKHWLFSFHTDKHFATTDDNEPGQNIVVKTWDNYHLTFGTQRVIGRSDWVMGLRYSFAQLKNAKQPYSFDDPTEGNLLQGERQTGRLVATSFQLMLSYAFSFK